MSKYRDNFCLIINGSKSVDDAYILPYSKFKFFFTEDYLDDRPRWVGTLRKNRLYLTKEGIPTKSISVTNFYNAFDLLYEEFTAVAPLTVKEEIIIKNQDEVYISDIKKLIAEFNRRYASVTPEKRILVSDEISRPGTITDLIKTLQNYQCQICHITGFTQRNGSLFIEAHHIIELHNLIPGAYCSDNIIVVCPTCHRKLHYASVSYEKMDERNVAVVINGQRTIFRRNIIS